MKRFHLFAGHDCYSVSTCLDNYVGSYADSGDAIKDGLARPVGQFAWFTVIESNDEELDLVAAYESRFDKSGNPDSLHWEHLT